MKIKKGFLRELFFVSLWCVGWTLSFFIGILIFAYLSDIYGKGVEEFSNRFVQGLIKPQTKSEAWINAMLEKYWKYKILIPITMIFVCSYLFVKFEKIG